MSTTSWPHDRDANSFVRKDTGTLFKTNKPIARLHLVDVPKRRYVKLPTKAAPLRRSTAPNSERAYGCQTWPNRVSLLSCAYSTIQGRGGFEAKLSHSFASTGISKTAVGYLDQPRCDALTPPSVAKLTIAPPSP